MTAIDRAAQRRITDCWSRELPGFDAWRPLRLLRRIGSVLQGVALEQSVTGDYYFAASHLHSLAREFPVISLSLSHRLLRSSGQPLHIPVTEDDVSSFASELIEQTAHSLREVPPGLTEIISTYHEFAIGQQKRGHPPAFMELEDSIFAAALADEPTLVETGLGIARQLADLWPRHRLPPDWPGADAWLNGLQSRAADPDHLTSIVRSQIEIHKLAKVRFSE